MATVAAADCNSENGDICSIKELVDAGLQEVPAIYIRPLQERAAGRPCADLGDLTSTVPVISLHSGGSPLLQQVAHACSEWGVFQVTNHGIPIELQNQLWSAAYHFFSLPTNTKLQLISQDPSCSLRFFTGFSSHENVKEWKDTLGFKPNHLMNPDLLPYFLRGPMLKFQEKIRRLAHKLCEEICSTLLLHCKNFCDSHLSRETMAFNYYPTCPEPDLTFGLSSHSDFGSLTIIMQDEAKGLQVRRGDEWIDVLPIPNTFIIMLGDQIEILTNGCYKSVEHRVVTNKKKPRMSIATFYSPSEHENVRPLEQFVSREHPLMYKETSVGDYLKHGFGHGLNGKANLQFSSLNHIP